MAVHEIERTCKGWDRHRPSCCPAPAETGGLVGPHLQAFFAEHLLAYKRAGPQTLSYYRDIFRLLLRVMRERTGAEPAALPPAALGAVLAFHKCG